MIGSPAGITFHFTIQWKQNNTAMSIKGLGIAFLFVLATLSGCQCSDKPEVGPVEESSVSVSR